MGVAGATVGRDRAAGDARRGVHVHRERRLPVRREDGPWAPNRRKIADLLDALAAIVHLAETVSMPTWLDGRAYDGLVVSVANGLLDVGRRELLPHDPRFFNATSVPFDFDPDALDPERWEGFLADCGARTGSRSTRWPSGSATRSRAGSTCTRSC